MNDVNVHKRKKNFIFSDIVTIAFDLYPPWAKIDNQVKEDYQYMILAMIYPIVI